MHVIATLCVLSRFSHVWLSDPMDCSPPGLLCSWDFPGENNGVGFHFLLQGIFLTQGLNPVSCTACRFFTNWTMREDSSFSYTSILTQKYLIFICFFHFWINKASCFRRGRNDSNTNMESISSKMKTKGKIRFHDLSFVLEKETATHSGTLAWRIPWTGEPGRLWSMGS